MEANNPTPHERILHLSFNQDFGSFQKKKLDNFHFFF